MHAIRDTRTYIHMCVCVLVHMCVILKFYWFYLDAGRLGPINRNTWFRMRCCIRDFYFSEQKLGQFIDPMRFFFYIFFHFLTHSKKYLSIQFVVSCIEKSTHFVLQWHDIHEVSWLLAEEYSLLSSQTLKIYYCKLNLDLDFQFT